MNHTIVTLRCLIKGYMYLIIYFLEILTSYPPLLGPTRLLNFKNLSSFCFHIKNTYSCLFIHNCIVAYVFSNVIFSKQFNIYCRIFCSDITWIYDILIQYWYNGLLMPKADTFQSNSSNLNNSLKKDKRKYGYNIHRWPSMCCHKRK